MRIPRAPSLIADCTARFMARRNATRRSSCWAMVSATSVASISGFLTSTILRCTSEEVSLASSVRSFSISAPFLPISTPGRAVCTVTRHFLCGRSITTLEIPACRCCWRMWSRMCMSSCSRRPYSPRLANQRLSHVRELGKRLLDRAHPAPPACMKAGEHQVLAHVRFLHHQVVDVEPVIVLGVGYRRHDALLHVLGDALPGELQIRQRHIHLLASDHLRQQVELLRRDAQVLGHGLRLVVGERSLSLRFAHLCRLQLAAWLLMPSWSSPSRPSCRRCGREKSWSARIRRTCGRSCLRSRSREYASGRCARRRSARQTAASWWIACSRCG